MVQVVTKKKKLKKYHWKNVTIEKIEKEVKRVSKNNLSENGDIRTRTIKDTMNAFEDF